MLKTISKATQLNWQRLHADVEGRLTRRANKTQSKRRVTAVGYAPSQKALQLLESVSHIDEPLPDVMFSLCCLKLQHYSLLHQPHVEASLKPFVHQFRLLPLAVSDAVWEDDMDVLGSCLEGILY